jgi:hypothetical protein
MAFARCTRHSQIWCWGCSQSETLCRTPAVVPSQVKRSAVAPKLTFARGPRDRRLGRSHAQIKAGDPAIQRGALHLVDQRSTALVLVLDGEDATVGQNAER